MATSIKGARLLREWRTRSGTLQKDLATQLGVDQAHVSRLESGDHRPGLELALKILEVTGIPAGAWLAEDDAEAA